MIFGDDSEVRALTFEQLLGLYKQATIYSMEQRLFIDELFEITDVEQHPTIQSRSWDDLKNAIRELKA